MAVIESNEKDIRKACREFFKKKHKRMDLQDEFTQWSIAVRPDLFGATKTKTISIEIKSDRDNFSRLDRQLLGYAAFSSSIFVALDEKHVEPFFRRFGDSRRFHHVGVLSYSKGKVSLVRNAQDRGIPNLYEMLWSVELQIFFSKFARRSTIPKSEKVAKALIERIFSYRDVTTISQRIFLNRIREKDHGAEIFEDIDMKEKEILFFKYLEEGYWHMYNGKRSRCKLD